MEIKRYTKKDIKQLTKSKSIPGAFNVFDTGNGIIKIYKDPMYDLSKFGTIVYPNGLVSTEQIEFLTNTQCKIYNSKLPNGIVYFENYPVGVTYPIYFENYDDFNALDSASIEEIIYKYRKATDNNIELLEHQIYNSDFTMRNILQKDKDVQLIDLDGKYIYKDLPYSIVYSYFVFGMTKQIFDKCIANLDDLSKIEIITEIKRRIEILNQKEKTIDYPHKVLDEIEKTKILKLK